MELSEHQQKILEEISFGGKIFEFDFPVEYGFDDADGNSLVFRKRTFTALLKNGFIEVKERPSIVCRVYGVSELGKNYLAKRKQID